MQYYWLYNNDMMYQTSAAAQYLQSLQISQEETAMLQEQIQAMQAQGTSAPVAIDEQTVEEYIRLLQNESTPDSEIEQFFQQKGLTDDQILVLQEKAVKQMEGMNAGEAAPIPTAAPSGTPGMQAKYCSTCGKELPANANFCDACGARQ